MRRLSSLVVALLTRAVNSVGFGGLSAGFAIGIVGDAGVRATAQQPSMYVVMILILIFAEALGLYGLIIGLVRLSPTCSVARPSVCADLAPRVGVRHQAVSGACVRACMRGQTSRSASGSSSSSCAAPCRYTSSGRERSEPFVCLLSIIITEACSVGVYNTVCRRM